MMMPAPVEMKEGKDGIWEYTVHNVAPDFYTYTFTVDEIRMPDPNNVHIVRDGQNITNIVIMPGEKSNLYLEAADKKGTLSKIWYPSPAFGATGGCMCIPRMVTRHQVKNTLCSICSMEVVVTKMPGVRLAVPARSSTT